MPLGPATRRVLFLSIAASFAKHRDNFSFFFKYDTMDPMIANAGFVRALETLVRLKEYAPADALEHDESDVRRVFWRGAAALALTSGPTADDEFGDRPEGLVAGFAELPAAREVFNPYQQKWVAPADAEGNRVPLAGWRGWVASTSATPQGEKGTTAADSGAANLLARLATDPLGTQLVLAQRDFVLVRPGQHGGLAARLTERGWTPEEADAYATTLASALERPDAVVDLRIPGRERYNQALDEGLTRALSGEVDAPTALEEVARRWKGITEELGVDAQRNDYKASLGL
jgi:multiple sugar transport system substrate-binding protein